MSSSTAASPSLLLASIARLATALRSKREQEVSLPPLPDDMLSFSGQLTAAARAVETERPADDRLISDPYAKALAGPVALARIRTRACNQPNGLVPRIPLRTKYFDDFASEALARLTAQPTQLVSLAAGMDTRAYRLLAITKTVSVFEVDVAQVLEYKQDVLENLQPRPTLFASSCTQVAADLSEPDWQLKLTLAGFDRDIPTVWLIEGLCYYLPAKRVQALLQEVAGMSAPRSSVCVSAVTQLSKGSSGLARMFLSAMPYPRDVMRGAGWRVDAVDALGGPRVNHGRWTQEWQPPAKDENGQADWSSTMCTIYVRGMKE